MANNELLLKAKELQKQVNELLFYVESIKEKEFINKNDSPKTSALWLKNWLTAKEVVDFFGYKPTQAALLLKDPLLKVVKVGQKKYVSKESFDSYLENKSKLKNGN